VADPEVADPEVAEGEVADPAVPDPEVPDPEELVETDGSGNGSPARGEAAGAGVPSGGG